MQIKIILKPLILGVTLSLLCSFSLFESEPRSFDEMASRMSQKFSAPIIKTDQLKALLKKEKVFLLDARELVEFKVSHIKNSTYVGFEKFDIKKIKQNLPKGSLIVVYCSVGYRSGKVADEIIEAGYKAYNLYGGLFGWSNSGNLVFDDNELATKKVHGFNQKWSKWITNGEVVL